jgi:hypothetical protein
VRVTLDELEAERGEVEPFELDLGDQVITLPHPRDMPFDSLINFNAEAPAAVLRTLMGDKNFDVFAGNRRVTLGVLESILQRYYAHYGLGTPGEEPASLRSVSGSAGPSKRTSRRKATA